MKTRKIVTLLGVTALMACTPLATFAQASTFTPQTTEVLEKLGEEKSLTKEAKKSTDQRELIATNCWEENDKEWYYLDDQGNYKTGWFKVGATWYYCNAEGIMQTGWVKTGGKWYYLKDNGAMVANNWVDGYFVNQSGAWVPNYKVVEGRWIKANGTYQFQNTNKTLAKGWKRIKGKWYFFDANGNMQIGWKKIKNKWYYLSASTSDGAMKTGWQSIKGKTYYLGEYNDGAMRSGWQKIKCKWYYLNGAEDGSVYTGILMWNNEQYYLTETGQMFTDGWYDNTYYSYEGNAISDSASGELAFMQGDKSTYSSKYLTEAKDVFALRDQIKGLPMVENFTQELALGEEYYVFTLRIQDIGHYLYIYDSDKEILQEKQEVLDGDPVHYYQISKTQLKDMWEQLPGEISSGSTSVDLSSISAVTMVQINDYGIMNSREINQTVDIQNLWDTINQKEKKIYNISDIGYGSDENIYVIIFNTPTDFSEEGCFIYNPTTQLLTNNYFSYTVTKEEMQGIWDSYEGKYPVADTIG